MDNSEELTLITSFPTRLIQGVNYPGEAQYLSLVPGLGGEVWYDDGAFTGLTKLMLKDFLDLAPMASHVHRFQQNNGTCAFWFLLDQQNRHLFIGPQDAVSVSLQRNARPRVPNWFAGEQTLHVRRFSRQRDGPDGRSMPSRAITAIVSPCACHLSYQDVALIRCGQLPVLRGPQHSGADGHTEGKLQQEALW